MSQKQRNSIHEGSARISRWDGPKDQRLRCGRERRTHQGEGRSLGGKGLSNWGKEQAVSKGVNLQRIYSVGTPKHAILKAASPSSGSRSTLEATASLCPCNTVSGTASCTQVQISILMHICRNVRALLTHKTKSKLRLIG